jgi:hypothetical protein
MKLNLKTKLNRKDKVQRKPRGQSLSSVLYTSLNAVLSPVLLLLVMRELTLLAIALLIVSKWRTVAIRPRYWFANIRANSVDFVVGLSTIAFMHDANKAVMAGNDRFIAPLLFWAISYFVWLLFIKPRSGELMVGLQAAASLALGLSAIFLYADRLTEVLVIVAAWVVGSVSARHFLSSYEEPYIGAISVIWGVLVAQLAWLANRWLIVYELFDIVRIPQITLICLLAGYSIAELYHLAKQGKLTSKLKTQIIGFGAALLVVVVVLSDWSGTV